jgi:hypothetical protein
LVELRQLKEVKSLKEEQSVTSQPTTESMPSVSTSQMKAGMAQAEIRMAFISSSAANPLLHQGIGTVNHVAITTNSTAPVNSSSLPITDIVPENVR